MCIRHTALIHLPWPYVVDDSSMVGHETSTYSGGIMLPNRYLLIAIIILTILLPWTAVVCAGTPPLWHGLDAGKYQVGFQRIWELDGSRIWPRSTTLDSLDGIVARPIRVDIWYPASSCPAKMTLGEYFRIEAPAPAFDDMTFLTRRWDEYSYRSLAGDSTAFERLIAAETAACAGSPAAPGRFPLVIYSAGWFNRCPDNTILAEYLASHGFVVATVPQLNPGLWTFNFQSDAPAQRRFLSPDTTDNEANHAYVVRIVLDFLRSTFMVPGEFDGSDFTQRYRKEGLEVMLRTASPQTEPERSDP